jgi:cephalosporin hydroxylase
MKLIIDTKARSLEVLNNKGTGNFPLYSKEAFQIISEQWIEIGWNQKYSYTFSWLGRPIIQLPEDIIRIQEVIYRVKPDIIIESGIAHGGSLILYASICRALNKGHVIGIDIEIRRHNREAIESHELFPYISLIEGDSTDPVVVAEIRNKIEFDKTVLVILDSCHTKQHVYRELEAYHPFVTPGSYIIATDGIMQDLYDVPRGKQEWKGDNPASAAQEFVEKHPEFIIEQPKWPFNESIDLETNVTYWPGAWLRRR